MPLLQQLPRGLQASYLLVEHRERNLFSSFERRVEYSAMKRFSISQRVLMSLVSSQSTDVYVTVCREQLQTGDSPMAYRSVPIPPECWGRNRNPEPGDSGHIAPAVKQVAWELCGSNARADARAAVESLCAEFTDKSRGASQTAALSIECVPSGYDAVLGPSETISLDPMFYPDLDTPCGSKDPGKPAMCVVEALAGRVASMVDRTRSSQEKGSSFNTLRFQGWASTEKITHAAELIAAAYFSQQHLKAETLPRLDDTTSELLRQQIEKEWCAGRSYNCAGSVDWRQAIKHLEKGGPKEVRMQTIWKVMHNENLNSLRLAPIMAPKMSLSTWVTDILHARGDNASVSNVGNSVLSMLRALGVASVIIKRSPSLCAEPMSCAVEAFGESLSAGNNHAVWRSFGVSLSHHAGAPRCSGLVAPTSIDPAPGRTP
jgi:hypothetical protein